MPADLKQAKNGKLEPILLRSIEPSGQLHHTAARAWGAMRTAAALDGVVLGQVGTYRSYDTQVALFKQRYQLQANDSSTTRVWNGVRYWLRRGVAPASSPGRSNHGWGLAVDVASIGSGGRLGWLLRNAERYGWSWELQSEPWHIRYVMGDTVPQAVIAFEGHKA